MESTERPASDGSIPIRTTTSRRALDEQGVQAVAVLRSELVDGVRVKDARYRVLEYRVQDAGQQGESVAGHDGRRRLLRDLQGAPQVFGPGHVLGPDQRALPEACVRVSHIDGIEI